MSTFLRSHPLRMLLPGLSMAIAVGASAAAFPEKPVRLIVPFAPGGGTDLVARTLGSGLARELGQPVIIENKPGAGTVIGSDSVAKSAPDGYTILVATFAHAVNPSLQPSLPYVTDKAFTPIILMSRGPNVLVVRRDSPYKSVNDVLAAARDAPDKVTYASQGVGTSAHLAGEMLANLGKVRLTHVPYKGAGPALTDLLGGQIDMMFGTAAAVSTYIDSGRLRAIAVTSEAPSSSFKGVPTVAEVVPGYAVESWYGLYAPARTPPDVIAKLNAAAQKAARGPEFTKKMEQEGLMVTAGDPAELDRYVRAEEARWRRIVKENNVRPD
jgi:tripartite-type tricarboxylate transporter receptor subunit TctC